jgi:acyl-CoA hydrolase
MDEETSRPLIRQAVEAGISSLTSQCVCRQVELRRSSAVPVAISVAETVHGGKLLEWIDKAGYACAVGWSAHYCVTAYVGDVHFTRPVAIGELVEVSARMVHTGRSSMHILVVVSSTDPKDGAFTEAT